MTIDWLIRAPICRIESHLGNFFKLCDMSVGTWTKNLCTPVLFVASLFAYLDKVFNHIKVTLAKQFSPSNSLKKHHQRSSWRIQPNWTIWTSNWIISPGRGEHKKAFELPPSDVFIIQGAMFELYSSLRTTPPGSTADLPDESHEESQETEGTLMVDLKIKLINWVL